MLPVLPNEIINHIFCYCQSSTNKIIKDYIKSTYEYCTGVIGLYRLNRDYGFKHFNKKILNSAIICCCTVCKINLWPCEYKKNINFMGNRMCSRRCLLEYEMLLYA